MSIYNYEILNPVISPKRPFYDIKRKLLFFLQMEAVIVIILKLREIIKILLQESIMFYLVIENLMIIVEFVMLIIMADVKLI